MACSGWLVLGQLSGWHRVAADIVLLKSPSTASDPDTAVGRPGDFPQTRRAALLVAADHLGHRVEATKSGSRLGSRFADHLRPLLASRQACPIGLTMPLYGKLARDVIPVQHDTMQN